MSETMLYDFKKQLFIIHDSGLDGAIVYAPLKNVCFWVDNEYASLLNSFLVSSEGFEMLLSNKDLYDRIRDVYMIPTKTPSPREFRIRNHAVLILSERCNFGCSYCYAQNAHCSDVISWSAISKAVDAVMHCSDKVVRITFIGGGEPLVTYRLVQQTVDYAENLALIYQKQVVFSITTNGSLISEKISKWMRKHNFRVSVSFDILPSIQNLQRPLSGGKESFGLVDCGISNLINAGIIPRFRSTITTANVLLMPQMVQYASEKYPQVNKLHFEHVSDNSQNLEQFYADYIANFFDAKHLAKQKGIQLSNSITTSMKQLKDVFCAGEFCIVPDGSFVSCHRVSSVNDSYYNLFKVSCGDANYDFENTIEVEQTQMQLSQECTSCFARWHCAGGCVYNRLLYNDMQIRLFCRFTREMVKRSLEDQLNLTDS